MEKCEWIAMAFLKKIASKNELNSTTKSFLLGNKSRMIHLLPRF